jgi:hypothetical protein
MNRASVKMYMGMPPIWGTLLKAQSQGFHNHGTVELTKQIKIVIIIVCFTYPSLLKVTKKVTAMWACGNNFAHVGLGKNGGNPSSVKNWLENLHNRGCQVVWVRARVGPNGGKRQVQQGPRDKIVAWSIA